MALSAAAGLLAGILAWGAGETRAVNSGPVEEKVNFMGSGTMVPIISHEARLAGVRLTAIKAFGVLGGLTGLLLGLVGGASVGQGRRAALAGGVGLMAGILVGAGVPWATLSWFEQRRAGNTVDLLPSLLMHSACWIPIGAVGGLALGLGRRDRILSALVGGVLGALLATVVYDMIGAGFFSLSGTGEPLSLTPMTRLLGRVLVATFVAVGAALAFMSPAQTPEAVTG